MQRNGFFYKNNENDQIWWFYDTEVLGQPSFSFDKKKVFYLFGDYPDSLTPDQKDLFDKENPYWAQFFRGEC